MSHLQGWTHSCYFLLCSSFWKSLGSGKDYEPKRLVCARSFPVNELAPCEVGEFALMSKVVWFSIK